MLETLDRFDELLKETRAEGSRWSRVEYAFDSRGFNVFHYMGHTPLPFGFNVWGFIDIEGDDLPGANREDLSRYFLEIDLKRKLWDTGGVIAEVNDLHGDGNAIGRFGVFWKPDTEWLSPEDGFLSGKLHFAIKFFPVETDGQGGQFSFNYNKNFDGVLGGRFSAGGFFDFNYDIGATGFDSIVSEHQLRVRVAEGLHFVTEFRVNEFLRNDFGISHGLQYRF